ncbi:hypothetical protein ACMFMG_000733 [Clarireedia jacksonii]
MNPILCLPYRRVTTLRNARAASRYLQSRHRIIRGVSSHSSNGGNEQGGKDINTRIDQSGSLDAIQSESTENVASNSGPDVQYSPEASTSASQGESSKSRKTRIRRILAKRLKALDNGVEPDSTSTRLWPSDPKRNAVLRFPSPRQFTIIFPNPKFTQKGDVIAAVRANRMPEHLWHSDWRGPEQALIVLATPSFARWLEDDTFFMPSLLESLTYRDPAKQNSIIVITAVVDGLAPTPDGIPVAERLGGLEGISVLHGQRADLLRPGDVWDPQSLKTQPATSGKLSHLIISGTDPLERAAITLPLANTLFVNGKHSTLVATQWIRGQTRSFFQKIRAENKQYQEIRAFRRGDTIVPPIFIPSVPLTPARRIASGLGNIVRQINFGPGEESSGPASQELETQVTNYMNYSKPDTNIGVWALIFRKELVGRPFRGGWSLSPPMSTLWKNERENARLIGMLIATGAILCRVLSGGGGWGLKQGLLSLDPQVNYENIEEARFNMSPGASKQEMQDTALGDLARAGDWIQFFTVSPSKVKHSYEGPEPLDLHYWQDSITKERLSTPDTAEAAGWMESTVFGAVPSTIDKMPGNDDGIRSEGGVVFQQGHFGAVTESGLFLRSEQRLRKEYWKHISITSEFHSYDTKIDIPHSYVYRKLFFQEASSLNSTAFRYQRVERRPRFRQSKILGQPEDVD